MPGIVRSNVDEHVGHASPTPSPFHKTKYDSGSPDVITNNEQTIRVTDTTGTTVYDENVDYVIVYPTTVFELMTIGRVNGSSITDGQDVIVTYWYADPITIKYNVINFILKK